MMMHPAAPFHALMCAKILLSPQITQESECTIFFFLLVGLNSEMRRVTLFGFLELLCCTYCTTKEEETWHHFVRSKKRRKKICTMSNLREKKIG